MYKLLIGFMFILAVSGVASAQKTYSGAVQVQVVSSKDTPQNSMLEDLTKEINSFVDVKVTDKNPDLSIIVFLEKIPTSGPGFYAVTFTYFRNAECSYKNAIVDGKVLRTDCRALAKLSTTGFIPETAIKDKAKEIVTSFNKDILDPERKAFAKNKSF